MGENRQKAVIISVGGALVLAVAVFLLIWRVDLNSVMSAGVCTLLGVFMLVVARGLWMNEEPSDG